MSIDFCHVFNKKEKKDIIVLLPFHSAGHMNDGQPVDIPLHDSELVYVVEELRQVNFGKLVKSLKIPEKDLRSIPFDESPHTREMRIDALGRWRDKQKDPVQARATLAQSLAHIEIQETKSQRNSPKSGSCSSRESKCHNSTR